MFGHRPADTSFEPVDEVLRSHLSDHSTGGETCFGDVSQHTILAFHR